MTTALFALAVSEGRNHIGMLADGTPVFTKMGPDHLAAHPEVRAVVVEALAKLSMADFVDRDLSQVVEMGRVVGDSTCIDTRDGDEIVYARRRGRRDGCSRFIRGYSGQSCSTVVIRLYKTDNGLIALMTAFIGADAPAEPCSPSGRKDRETWEAASEFWRSHALCWDGEVEPGDFAEADFFGVPPTE